PLRKSHRYYNCIVGMILLLKKKGLFGRNVKVTDYSAGFSAAILCGTSSQSGYRNISSFDRDSDSAPILEITYIPR
ncbi:MAG: hypothetical protein WBC05_01990, partial [Sedimentisphaerales bacterium]